MSATQALPLKHQHDSDSEDDADYVPANDSGSESYDEEPDSKRARTSPSPPKLTEEDKVARKQIRDDLWASFEASVAAPVAKPEPETKNLVKVVKKYRFAGEDVTEVVEVPEDSEDTKKWPLWVPPQDLTTVSSSPTLSSPSMHATPPSGLPDESLSKLPPLAGKRAGPRKPKLQLGDIPTTASQKAKKLTTLEKSAMDWKSHVSSQTESQIKDELDANRRGGGYLEKVEFLDRVGERRELALEGSKGTKRRRG